jgi:hypothetical protein
VTYIGNLLIAIDQLLNAIAGGWCDETLSARAWREGRESRYWSAVRRAIDALFFLQQQHCFNAYLSEYERKHLPEGYRV